MKKLLDKINELESIKEKQSIKLAKYRDEIDNVSHEVSKTRTSSDSAVQALSQELRHLKQNLDKTLDREKQVNIKIQIYIQIYFYFILFKLIDFRSVIARMLSLDVNSLAVADYEIIARIEKIVTAFNGGFLPVQLHQVQAIYCLR